MEQKERQHSSTRFVLLRLWGGTWMQEKGWREAVDGDGQVLGCPGAWIAMRLTGWLEGEQEKKN